MTKFHMITNIDQAGSSLVNGKVSYNLFVCFNKKKSNKIKKEGGGEAIIQIRKKKNLIFIWFIIFTII